MAHTASRGANGNQGSKWIRPEKRLAIYMRDGFECVYCGRDVAHDGATLDHIRSRAAGGTNKARNLVTACFSCNSARAGRSLRQWADERMLQRVARCRRRKLPLATAKAVRAGEYPIEAARLHIGGGE